MKVDRSGLQMEIPIKNWKLREKKVVFQDYYFPLGKIRNFENSFTI